MNKNTHQQKAIGVRRFHIRLFLLLPLLLSFLLISFHPAQAHTDGALLQVYDVPAGPFMLSVWTYPTYLLPGPIHFSVSVLEAESGNPLPAVAVFVEAKDLSEEIQSKPVDAQAFLDLRSLYHETDLVLDKPGKYQITVLANAGNNQMGETSFEIKVVSGTSYKIFILVMLAFTGAAAFWLFKEGFRTWGIDHLAQKLAGVLRR